LKENPIKISEFLKNRYFSNRKSPRFVLIPEKTTFSKKNLLVLPELLKNKYYKISTEGNPLKISNF
jgi:hypothetical protein